MWPMPSNVPQGKYHDTLILNHGRFCLLVVPGLLLFIRCGWGWVSPVGKKKNRHFVKSCKLFLSDGRQRKFKAINLNRKRGYASPSDVTKARVSCLIINAVVWHIVVGWTCTCFSDIPLSVIVSGIALKSRWMVITLAGYPLNNFGIVATFGMLQTPASSSSGNDVRELPLRMKSFILRAYPWCTGVIAHPNIGDLFDSESGFKVYLLIGFS